MRTNVVIDDSLMTEAMAALGTRTKKETIEIALKLAIRDWKLRKVADLWGSAEWEGDLMKWRRSRDFGGSSA